MKVLLVGSLYYPHERGGAERALRTVADEISRRGNEVVVVCISGSSYEQRDNIGSVRVVRLPLINIFNPFVPQAEPQSHWKRFCWHLIDDWNPLMARHLMQVVREENPDIIDFHNVAGFSAASVAAARRSGLPVVQTLHDYYYACPRTTMFRDDHNCDRPCAACTLLTIRRRREIRHVQMVIAVSQALLQQLEDVGALRGVLRREVVWNPIDPKLTPSSLKAEVHGRLRLGFLGRLDVTKGLETLLDAVTSLQGCSVSLTIAGNGSASYEAKLKRRAEGLPVIFLGHVKPDVLFEEIDFLVVPSAWREPFGLVVQEALSYGVPVIGARTGGIPEVLGDGTGYLFNPGDSRHLATILRHLVESPKEALRRQNRCRVRSGAFDTAVIIKRRLKLYRELVVEQDAARNREGSQLAK